jgi:hypothetical protein
MEVDLQSEVADFSCKRSILQPILEAVSNSIQANGSNIYIYITIKQFLMIKIPTKNFQFVILKLLTMAMVLYKRILKGFAN